MNIPEGFTKRGDSNEQPPETYDKKVFVHHEHFGDDAFYVEISANRLPWKIPDGPMRITAYKVLP